MAVTTPILYNNTSLFTYDNTLIQILSNKASLVGAPTYSTTNPNILVNFRSQASAISGFTETKTVSGSDQIQYTLVINGNDYYWNGSSWVSSDKTYAKSNLASAINTNCGHASLTALLTGGAYVQVRAFLHSASGATTPSLTEVDLTYTFLAITPSNPTKCIVYLYLQDIIGTVVGTVQSAKFSVKNNDAFKYGSFVILPFIKSTTFNSSGYAQLTLDETQTPGYPVNFSVTYIDGKGTKQIDFVPCIVTNSGAIDLMSITVPFQRGSGLISTGLGSSSGNGGGFSFETIVTPNGTNPQATNSTDTLTLTSSDSSVTITGSNITKTIDFQALSDETQVTVSDNAASQNLTGFSIDPATYRSAIISYSLLRKSTLGILWEVGSLVLRYDDVNLVWLLDNPTLGGNGPGTTFAPITDVSPLYTGTIQFTTDSFSLGGSSYFGKIGYRVLQRFTKES